MNDFFFFFVCLWVKLVYDLCTFEWQRIFVVQSIVLFLYVIVDPKNYQAYVARRPSNLWANYVLRLNAGRANSTAELDRWVKCWCCVALRGWLLDLVTATEEGTCLGLWILEPEDKAASSAKFTTRRLRLPWLYLWKYKHAESTPMYRGTGTRNRYKSWQ